MASAKTPAPSVALLRGVNVGGNKRLPMAELRALCEGLGWRSVRTYIQSGNVVFSAGGRSTTHARLLAAAIAEHFGLAVPVIVRSGTDWLCYAARSPFPEAETQRANLLHLALAGGAPKQDVIAALEPYCRAGERAAILNGALWIDFPAGVARSRLTPAVLDRALGSPVTARNWKTVQAIAALVRES